MRQNLFLILVLITLLTSCSQSSRHADNKISIVKIDSTKININTVKEKYVSVVRNHYFSEKCSVVVKSTYIMPDSLKEDSTFYCEGDVLFIINKAGIVLDSVKLEESENCVDDVKIQDVTNELHFKNLVFSITTPIGDDNYTSEFIEYSNNTLKKLFEIDEPITLQWKDKHTLTGLTSDRDELVSNFEEDTVIVSLDNYEVKYKKPIQQEIHYETETLENFNGYRISLNEKKKYLIKKGSKILIDSLNRKTNIVRLIVKDTIIIYVPFKNIKDKVQGDNAG